MCIRDRSNQLGKYAISMQPLQLFCRDVPITFERIYKRSTIGLTLGYRFDSKLNENPIQQISYYAGNDFGFTAPRFKGITLGINSKLFLDKERTFYLEGQLFYRYWWFNDRMYINSTGTGADNYVYLVSGNRNVVGLKMLVGMRPVSYTHLDVYKRQELFCAKSSNCNSKGLIIFLVKRVLK